MKKFKITFEGHLDEDVTKITQHDDGYIFVSLKDYGIGINLKTKKAHVGGYCE